MNKIKYHKVRDCYYPDLKINENKIELTRFGSELLEYMQQHRNSMYFSMLCNGSLCDYLKEMDQEMNEQYDLLVEQFKNRRGITEKLKAQDQLAWVREMNNIDHCVREIIRDQFIYH